MTGEREESRERTRSEASYDKSDWPERFQERLEEIENQNFVVAVRPDVPENMKTCVECGDRIEGDIFVPEGVGAMCGECWINWVKE